MTLMDLCMFGRSSRAAIVLGVFADPCNFSAGTLWRCWLTEGVDFVRRIGICVLFCWLICGRTALSSRQMPGNTSSHLFSLREDLFSILLAPSSNQYEDVLHCYILPADIPFLRDLGYVHMSKFFLTLCKA